jgi:hypothetical protein
MATRETRRAGWYADPLGHADLRWWDSQNWTTQVTSSNSERSRPDVAPRPAPAQWADEEQPSRTLAESAPPFSPPMAAPRAEPKIALDATFLTPKPQAAPTGEPDWSPLMLALLNAGDNIVTASGTSIPTMTIDMAGGTYWWDLSLDSFPAHPVDIVVNSVPRSGSTMPSVAGRFSEPLLWRVGTSSQALAKLVDPTLRYKLRRWPHLETLPHSTDQLRAINMLANAQLTVAELSAIADVDELSVQTLIGTFALMALLDSVKDPATSR